ncbi:MAG: alkaline phosphatase family protein [Deltaproteobacteria bacterium]|nr:alkaline phosphatase family protein [Deltaproteobacteria bacterium]
MAGNFKHKVFVLGLDGATLDLIKPWVEQMELPNFARLMAQGCHGNLESVLPPLTTPAWASFATGKNPGKHGIFDFAKRKPESYDIEWNTSLSRKGKSLWNIVSSQGGNVVVVNIPNNYPLEPVNGSMVAWMDAPGKTDGYTYPRELAKEIEQNVGDYIITILDWKENEDLARFQSNLHRMIDKRAELTFYLMENKPWDFFAVLFSATDIAQHCFWSFMDPSHPLYNRDDAERFGDTILETYRHIDRILGEIQDRLPDDATLILMSDHGAGPLRSVVNLNKWLEENGWLTFTNSTNSGASKGLHSLSKSFVRSALSKSLSLLKRHLSTNSRSRLKSLFPGVRDKLEGVMFSSLIDWEKTKAYSLGSYGNIYINLRDREPGGVVSEGEEYEMLRDAISSRLMKLTDPVTGQGVVKKVFRREEIYNGSCVFQAADLLVQWDDAGYHSVQRFGKQEDTVFTDQLHLHLTNMRFTGHHRMEGTFASVGKGVKQDSVIEGARIIDVAPTVLYLLGLPIPSDMDGRVLEDAFRPEYLAENPIGFTEAPGGVESASEDFAGYSADEADKIAERLRNLGYID